MSHPCKFNPLPLVLGLPVDVRVQWSRCITVCCNHGNLKAGALGREGISARCLEEEIPLFGPTRLPWLWSLGVSLLLDFLFLFCPFVSILKYKLEAPCLLLATGQQTPPGWVSVTGGFALIGAVLRGVCMVCGSGTRFLEKGNALRWGNSCLSWETWSGTGVYIVLWLLPAFPLALFFSGFFPPPEVRM